MRAPSDGGICSAALLRPQAEPKGLDVAPQVFLEEGIYEMARSNYYFAIPNMGTRFWKICKSLDNGYRELNYTGPAVKIQIEENLSPCNLQVSGFWAQSFFSFFSL